MKNPFKRTVVKEEVVLTPEQYIFSDAKEAMDKLTEVSGGKNFQYDIKPYSGMLEKGKNDFLVIKEGETWFLRIC
jgi:hypothetical protein